MADDDPRASWERNFRAEMRSLREAKGLTQTDLARELKRVGLAFHQSTIAKIETGERPVRLNEAFLIAQVLGEDVGTMTSTSLSDAERDARYVVDRLRRRADLVADELTRLLSETGWIETLSELSGVLHDLLAADMRSGSASGLTIWIGAWVAKAQRATRGVTETEFLFVDSGVATEYPDDAPDIQMDHDITEMLRQLTELLPDQERLRPEHLSMELPNDLLALLRGDNALGAPAPFPPRVDLLRDEIRVLESARKPVTEKFSE